MNWFMITNTVTVKCLMTVRLPSCAAAYGVTRSYVQHKIRSAKRSAHSELSVSRGEWQKHGYAKSDILSIEGLQDTVPRIHVSVSSCSCIPFSSLPLL